MKRRTAKANGRPIKSFRRAWLTACLQAGFARLVSEKPRVIVALRIPHDFRRTAIRNLERAGVPRSAAMKMVGHKTESVYRRYAIVDEATLREGAARLQGLHNLQGATGWCASNATRLGRSSVRVEHSR
jgi:integrase